jgi:glycosyltransferase involved in cell wall biosynthesis
MRKYSKILFNTYPTAFDKKGGGEIQLLQYRNLSLKNGYDIDLFNQWIPNLRNYDLLHFFSCMSGSIYFCDYVKKLNIPIFLSPNLFIDDINKFAGSFEEIRNLLITANVIIVNSEIEKFNLSRSFNVPDSNFSVVYNGVSENFLKPANASLFKNFYNIQEPFLLNVANIESRKNQVFLAEAIKKIDNLSLVIIGGTRDESILRKCKEILGKRLHIIDYLPHDSDLLKSAYAACEAFILPSLLETPGLAALEAASVGAKIIITSIGSAFEYFGEGAVYLDPNDIQSIVSAINESLSRPKDFLLSFLVRGNYTWQHTLNKLFYLYDSGLVLDKGLCKNLIIEKDSYSTFFWTNHQHTFYLPSGSLAFYWRSVSKCLVKIFMDNIFVGSFTVNDQWQYFRLEIIAPIDADFSKVYFEIQILNKNDFMEYGVCIREVDLVFGN